VTDHLLGEVTHADEVDEHDVHIREGWSGETRAVEQRVDVTADLLDRGAGGIGIPKVHDLVARDLHRRLLQVEHVHLCAEVDQLADGPRAHTSTTATAHDDAHPLVAPHRRHGFPSSHKDDVSADDDSCRCGWRRPTRS
jgi:hypothetical protein